MQVVPNSSVRICQRELRAATGVVLMLTHTANEDIHYTGVAGRVSPVAAVSFLHCTHNRWGGDLGSCRGLCQRMRFRLPLPRTAWKPHFPPGRAMQCPPSDRTAAAAPPRWVGPCSRSLSRAGLHQGCAALAGCCCVHPLRLDDIQYIHLALPCITVMRQHLPRTAASKRKHQKTEKTNQRSIRTRALVLGPAFAGTRCQRKQCAS